MVRVLKRFPKRELVTGNGRRSKYDVDEWYDGQIREFVQGEDFECRPKSFHSALNKEANRRGLKSHGECNGRKVVFRAWPRKEWEQ